MSPESGTEALELWRFLWARRMNLYAKSARIEPPFRTTFECPEDTPAEAHTERALRAAFVRGFEAGRDAAAACLHEAARLAHTRHLHDALNAHASAIRALVAPEGP